MNLNRFQAHAYKKTSVETADPGRVLIALYDAAIKFSRLAAHSIDEGKVAEKGVYISKTHRIISEFINALDFEKSPALCEQLEGIYGFMISQLIEANVTMKSAPLNPVISQLEDLRDTWTQAMQQQTPSTLKQVEIGL